MAHIGIVLSILIKILHCTFFVSGSYATELNSGLCIRDANEVKKKFNTNKRIAISPEWGYDDTYYLNMLEGSSAIVDKSLLIKRILDTKEKVIFITSPPKTGKSVNLHMLKAFFETRNQKSNASIYPPTRASTYKFFTKGELNTADDSPLQPTLSNWPSFEMDELTLKATYTNPPMISNYKDIIDQHLAAHPVIYLEFYSLFSKEFNLTFSLRKQICDPYVKFKFAYLKTLEIFESNKTNEEDVRTAFHQLGNFTFYDNYCTQDKPLSPAELERSILILCEIMYTQIGKPVIILVDEYASLIAEYLLDKEHGQPQQLRDEDAKHGIQLLKNFMRNTFCENPYLEKAVLTGSLQFNKNHLLADMCDFVYYNVVENHLQEFYGITEDELQMLFDHFEISPEYAQRARNFYKGYTLRPKTNLTIYNVWSIINFLNEKKIDKYWIDHRETFNKLKRWIDIEELDDILDPLLNGSDVLVSYTEMNFDTRDAIFANKTNYNRRDVNCILTLLWEMGFLTLSDRENHNGKTNDFYLRIPNNEVKRKFEELIN